MLSLSLCKTCENEIAGAGEDYITELGLRDIERGKESQSECEKWREGGALDNLSLLTPKVNGTGQ